MSAQHLQGQDVTLRISQDGAIVDSLAGITSCEVVLDVSAEQLDFLGETSPRFEEVSGGVTINLDIRHRDPAYLRLMQAIQDRAEHKRPGLEFSASMKLAFPNGRRPVVLIRDLAWNSPNLNSGGRREFTTSRLTAKAPRITKITGA